jgi:hypothetical protein
MRFNEFKDINKNVDEALPAIGAVAKAAGAAVGAAAKGAKKIAGQAAKAVGAKAVGGATTSAGKSTAGKVAQQATQAAAQQLLKRGNAIPMPTQDGKQKEFEIDDVKGDEVTLVNPDAKNAPEEPEKVTYKKKDLDTIIQSLAQGEQ